VAEQEKNDLPLEGNMWSSEDDRGNEVQEPSKHQVGDIRAMNTNQC